MNRAPALWRLLLLPILPLLAVAASGGFRTVLGVSLDVGLLFSIAASAPIVLFLARVARPGWVPRQSSRSPGRCPSTRCTTAGSRGLPSVGLIGSSWPLTIFLNANFGLWQDWPQYENLRLLRETGRCWFWYGQPDPFGGFGAQVIPPSLPARAQELERAPATRCEEYPAHWDPRVTVRLCHACRQAPP